MSPTRAGTLAVGAVALLIVAFMLAACSSVDKAVYVRDNERILDSLPVFPGARQIARGSYGDHADNGDLGLPAPTIGYETGVNYRVPDGTRWREVIAFYVGHMRGWQPGEINYEDGIADFTRGKAYVSVDASELGMTRSDRRHIVGVSVDKLGAVQQR